MAYALIVLSILGLAGLAAITIGSLFWPISRNR